MQIATIASLCGALVAQEPDQIKTPEEVQAELDQAQKDFEAAKELFIPWYTGPLITGSANNAPKGKVNTQAYIFLNNEYAVFNNNRKSIDVPDVFTVEPLFIFQYGFTDFLDSTLILDGFFRWKESEPDIYRKGEEAGGFGDISYALGFQIVKQTPYIPSVRFTVAEVFPTGKYRNFNPDNADIAGTGGGVFATQFSLFLNKIFWKLKRHPVSVRLAGSYLLPNHEARVKGFNTYGGGFGTDGNVCVGHGIQAGLGVEVSLTQQWVFAFDVAYNFAFATDFTGFVGVNADGTLASVGGPSNDQLSLAPAIEYNVSATGGFIGGIWFSVTGRNSPNFVAGVLSYTQLF